MRVLSVQIVNYKSYGDSGPIWFGPGFNVLVGQNNSGKTALLEALVPPGPTDTPHKSMENGRPKATFPHSVTNIDLSISGAELRDYFFRSSRPLSIPIVTDSSNTPTIEKEINNFFAQEEIKIEIKQSARTNG